MLVRHACHRLWQKSHRLFLVVFLLLLGACSSTTFVYNRLDFILPWYLDDYVELNRAQGKSLDGLLKPFLRWHRLEELPRYVLILSDIEASLDHTVNPDVIDNIFSAIETAWLRLEDRSMGWMLELGGELSEGQIAKFLAVLEEEQEEYEEKYLPRSEEEYQDESYDNFVDGLEDYLGRLDSGQKMLLHDASSKLIRMDVLWLDERATWLANLNSLLQRKPGWQQALRDLKAAREDNYSPEYREMYAHNLEVIERAIASVVDSRSAKQDKRLRNKLKNLREDFEKLIAQGARK